MSEGVVQRRAGPVYPGQDPALADWLVALSHDGPFERPQAGPAGEGAAPPLASVRNLLSLLNDSERGVRLRAARALGDLGGEIRRVLPALRAALREAVLNDGDDGVRAEAVRALLRAGPQPATEVGALVDALRNDVDVARFHAATALGNLGSAGWPAVPALIHASLWDEGGAVRVAAAMALWKIDPGPKAPLVLHVLTRALDDVNEMVCWIATDCLGQMGPAARGAVPALRQSLRRDFRIALIKTGMTLALERIDPQAAAGAGVSAGQNPPADEGTPRVLPRVRIHKIAWNGNDGEVWYTDADGSADYLRAMLGGFGFHVGKPVARPAGDGTLQALPVVKPGCSLTELQDVCRNDPGLEIGPRNA